MPATPFLSKSRVLSALQCPKNLYLKVNHPELERLDPQIMATGHHVGALARNVLGNVDGVLIEHDQDLHRAIEQTEQLMALRDRPLYEATFAHQGVLVRVDILIPTRKGWRVIEVKSSGKNSFIKSGPKRRRLVEDCAVQAWVLRGSGVPIESVNLALIDNDWVYQGNSNYNGLFALTNVDDEVESLMELVPRWIVDARNALANDMPKVDVGMHCSSPYRCAFWDQCWPVKDAYPVTALGGPGLVASLVNRGITDVRNVPGDWLESISGEKTKLKAKWVWSCVKSGKPQIDPEIRKWFSKLKYPRYYLDFEAASSAIPLFVNSRPFEVIPFQYSCHVEDESGELDHVHLLDLSGADPRRLVGERLIADLGTSGDILTYSQYEFSIVKNLMVMYPDLTIQLQAILARMKDMRPPLADFVLHPEMHGSWSIKHVAPAFCPSLSYKDKDGVSTGNEAVEAYLEAISTSTDRERKRQLEVQLMEYCELDTLSMLEVSRFFLQPTRE